MIVFVFFWSIVNNTWLNLYFLYSSSQAILQLSQSVREHLVTPIDVSMHVITCNPGHIWFSRRENKATLSPSPPRFHKQPKTSIFKAMKSYIGVRPFTALKTTCKERQSIPFFN